MQERIGNTGKPRKSLTEMAAREPPMNVAGMLATRCPYCGCDTFVNGVNRTDKEIARYIECRNANCRDSSGKPRRFLTYQPPAKIVREITKDDNSAGGKSTLAFVRKVG